MLKPEAPNPNSVVDVPRGNGIDTSGLAGFPEVPAGYSTLKSGGAAANETGGLPDGFRRIVNADGEVVIQSSSGKIYPSDNSIHIADHESAVLDLANFREDIGLPKSGSAADRSTLAVIEVDGKKIYGINAHGTEVSGVNSISKTHAEIDALNQIKTMKIDVSGQSLTLYVDRQPFTACGQNGGIRSMVRQLGLSELKVVGPDGIVIIRP
nr:deaminase [Xanthomonas sp. D-93]